MPNPYGDEALTRNQQKQHVANFRDAAGPILEIGCGRGAMLTLLNEAGIVAYGLDSSETAVGYCRAKGLTVVKSNALEHLTGPRSIFLRRDFLRPRNRASRSRQCGGNLSRMRPDDYTQWQVGRHNSQRERPQDNGALLARSDTCASLSRKAPVRSTLGGRVQRHFSRRRP